MMEPLIGYYMHPPSPRHHLEDSIMNSIMKAQFQQKQMQEKEHKLLQMLDSQQQMALQKAGLNGVLPSKYSNNAYNNAINSGTVTPNSFQPGKVRQMFEERRKGGGSISSNNLYNSNSANGNTTPGGGSYRNGGIVGIDKSYPLDPIVAPKRSSSSKSDPNPNSYAVRNTHRSKVGGSGGGGGGTAAAITNSKHRGISLDRKQQPRSSSRDGRESSFSTNGAPPLGAYRRANSGLSRSSYDDELTLRPSNIGSTTKYADIYGNNNKSPSPDTIAHRESVIAAKMKGLQVTEPVGPPEVAKPPKAPLRSKSPMKKAAAPAPVPPARSKTSTINPAGSRTTAAPKQSLSRTASKTPPPPAARGPPPPGLDECKICGRYFAPDRIAKHETICKKTTTKKRKVFDPTKMRMQGTEAEPYIRQVSAKPSRPSQKAAAGHGAAAAGKKSDWRKKHEEFIRTIRAAKEYQAHVAAGGNPADLPPPPPSDTSDYVQCPHCGRKFSEGAADRHIPKCKNIKSNKR